MIGKSTTEVRVNDDPNHYNSKVTKFFL
jgi:hypothetical protein